MKNPHPTFSYSKTVKDSRSSLVMMNVESSTMPYYIPIKIKILIRRK